MKSEAGSKRDWEAPVATMLSIRLTANTGGGGWDGGMGAPLGGQELTSTAPTIDKASQRAVADATVVASGADERGWEAPVATMLSIRLTAQTPGFGADNYGKHDVFGGKELTPAVPTIDKASRRAVAHTSVVASDQQAWEAPAVTTLPIR